MRVRVDPHFCTPVPHGIRAPETKGMGLHNAHDEATRPRPIFKVRFNHEEGAISLSDAARLIESHGDGMAEAFGAVEQFELVKVVEETRADVKLFLETQHGVFDYQWLIMSERTVGRFQQLVNELPKFRSLRYRRLQERVGRSLI